MRKRIASPVFVCKTTKEGSLERGISPIIYTAGNRLYKIIKKNRPYIKVWGEKKYLRSAEDISICRDHGFKIEFETV